MKSNRPESSAQGFAPVLERNISTLIARRRLAREQRGMQDRLAETISRFTGSMVFVYLHLAIFGSWVVINLGWTPIAPFDRSFVVLAMVASVEAIFLSTFVLIAQNRGEAEADRRADLELQISLLAEHEITRLLNLVTAIGRKLGVEESHDPELEPLKQDVAPEEVLDRLDAVKEKSSPK